MAAKSKLFRAILNPNLIQIRTLIKNKITPGGIDYYGFKYHPRHPDFKDPPYEPSKLFFITRIKPVKGTNPIERKALQKLNIDGEKRYSGHKSIVQNIPEVNALLWKIKHLISIAPITCPYGLPQDGDYNGTYLHSNGKFIVSHKLKIPEERIEAHQKFSNDEKQIKKEVIQKYLRYKWNVPYSGTIHERQES